MPGWIRTALAGLVVAVLAGPVAASAQNKWAGGSTRTTDSRVSQCVVESEQGGQSLRLTVPALGTGDVDFDLTGSAAAYAQCRQCEQTQ